MKLEIGKSYKARWFCDNLPGFTHPIVKITRKIKNSLDPGFDFIGSDCFDYREDGAFSPAGTTDYDLIEEYILT